MMLPFTSTVHSSASSSVIPYPYGTLTEGTGRSVNEEMDQR
jgi:hypothetical protein